MRDDPARPGREAETDETRVLRIRSAEPSVLTNREVLLHVYAALREKGYDPVRQLAHFLLSGEPAYITGYLNARSLVMRLERDEVIEELLRAYLKDAST